MFVEICRDCGAFYEVVDEEDAEKGCPECEDRRRRAEERSSRAKRKTLEQLTFERMEKAEELEEPIQLSDTIFTVISSGGVKSYTVVKIRGDKFTCDCPDFRYRKYEELKCKHIIKVEDYLKRQAGKHRAEVRDKIEARSLENVADPDFY